MRDTFFHFWAGGRPRQLRAELARFFRQTTVGKSIGHQQVSPADLPTIVKSVGYIVG